MKPQPIMHMNSKVDHTVTDDSAKSDVSGIALYTANKSLQAELLVSVLEQKSKLPCILVDKVDADIGDYLLLIDCQGQAIANLRAFVGDIHERKAVATAALINATANSDHENLLDWPCISGVFFSDTDQEQLFRGLESLLRGEYWVPRRLLHHFLKNNRRAPSNKNIKIKLTKRERQILKLIKEGATNSDIADALAVSEHTVKSHLYNVYKKIGVRNRLEASNWVRDIEDL